MNPDDLVFLRTEDVSTFGPPPLSFSYTCIISTMIFHIIEPELLP